MAAFRCHGGAVTSASIAAAGYDRKVTIVDNKCGILVDADAHQMFVLGLSQHFIGVLSSRQSVALRCIVVRHAQCVGNVPQSIDANVAPIRLLFVRQVGIDIQKSGGIHGIAVSVREPCDGACAPSAQHHSSVGVLAAGAAHPLPYHSVHSKLFPPVDGVQRVPAAHHDDVGRLNVRRHVILGRQLVDWHTLAHVQLFDIHVGRGRSRRVRMRLCLEGVIFIVRGRSQIQQTQRRIFRDWAPALR
mmetsp:Transcript_14287/g.40652  ORF Transcript_14287/g.40652 Transcript_14287/m.40652 type:complete len:245 (+) Transcript_14287:173-907(+)